MILDEKQLGIERLLDGSAHDSRELHREAARLTRRNLLFSAAECFAEQGYQQTTIREIASRAGVTLGALYHHFKDKKELLMTINRRRQIISLETTQEAFEGEEDFFQALRAAPRELFKMLADDPVLRGVTREYMGMALTDPDVKQMHSRNNMEFHELYSENLRRCYPLLSADRRFLLNHMILVAFEGLMTAMVVDSPMAVRPEQILDSLIEMLQTTVEKWSSESA